MTYNYFLIAENIMVNQYIYINIKMNNQGENLPEILAELDETILQNYKQEIENYKKCIIPFEIKRIKQNLSLSSKNMSLQRDKRQLMRKIQKMGAENQRQQYVMEGQAFKISHLQHTVSDLDTVNTQNLNIIQTMRQTSKQLEEEVNKKSEVLKNSEEEKKKILKDYDDKSNQYNSLLSNYMKDKNFIAQKLNYMNQLEQQIFANEKKLKQEQAYLKKQWEQFQQSKKHRQRPKIFKKPGNEKITQKQKQSEKPKYQKDQILRNPVKKIIKHHTNQINDASLNFNGNLLATCGGDRHIKIYDMTNLQTMNSIHTNAEMIPLSISLDYSGEKILMGSSDKSVHLFSTTTGKELHSFIGHGYKVNSVSWSAQKQKCVSGSEDKQIKIWDVQKVTNILSIQCGKAVKSINCSITQPLIYSGHSDGSVRLYSLNQSSTPISQIKGIIDYSINSIVVLNDRNQLLVSSQEGSPIHLFDLKMNKSILKYEGKEFFNTAARAQLSPSHKYVVAGNCDGNIYYWQKDKQSLSKKISGHDTGITVLKYHPISSYLVSCDKTGNVIIWQPNA